MTFHTSLYFMYARKIDARGHVKITRQWKFTVMRFRCHRKRIDPFASTLPFWCVFEYPHWNIRKRCDVSAFYKSMRQRYWVIVFILIRFPNVHTDRICLRSRIEPLSRTFLTRCVFDENAQRIAGVDGRPKRISVLVWTGCFENIIPSVTVARGSGGGGGTPLFGQGGYVPRNRVWFSGLRVLI